MKQRQEGFGASRGDAKIYVLAIILVVGGVFVLSKFGPVYQTKWEMEDYMEDLMRRYHTLGDEGMFDNLQQYVDRNNLGFNTYENCTFSGEEQTAGKFDCNYQVDLGLPGFKEKYKVHAHADVPKIPAISN